MLILRRRAGESILVGEDIEITVVEVGPQRVVLGIVAPEKVKVLRKEIQLTEEENRQAAVAPAGNMMRLAERLKGI